MARLPVHHIIINNEEHYDNAILLIQESAPRRISVTIGDHVDAEARNRYTRGLLTHSNVSITGVYDTSPFSWVGPTFALVGATAAVAYFWNDRTTLDHCTRVVTSVVTGTVTMITKLLEIVDEIEALRRDRLRANLL